MNGRDAILELTQRYADGIASEDEVSRLQERLQDDADARKLFRAYMELDAALTDLGDAATLLPVPRKAVSRPPAKRWWGIAAAVAAMVFGLYFGYQFGPGRDGNDTAPREKSSPLVAKLVAAMDAEWSGENQLAIGDELSAMPLSLEHGLAELRFTSGASVVLQGPSQCVLESPSHLLLQRGRLSASVPTRALGFSVRTSVAAVVDLGTEFGIHSDATGSTDIHVFRGQVALGTPTDADSRKELVDEGTAKRVMADGLQIEELRADELAFVSYQEFEARIKAEEDRPYYRWLAHSYRLRREPSLILYYSFDGRTGQSNSVINRSGSTAGKLDARLGDGLDASTRPQQMPSGRWPAERALRFDASRRQHLRVEHSNELNITQALTVAAWIRPTITLMESEVVILTKTPGQKDGNGPNYELGLVRRSEESGSARCAFYFRSDNRRIASPDFAAMPGRWIHLAAAANNGNVVLFVDGRPVTKGEVADFVPNDGDLLVGTRPGPSSSTEPAENASFEGWISELVMVRRFMSPDEVRATYSAGKQDRPPANTKSEGR